MPTVDLVLEVLEQNSFQRLPKPLLVGGATFEFDAAVAGTNRNHDLVIVSGPEMAFSRLRRLLSGLNRMLDELESPRPVSLVLVAPSLDLRAMNELAEHARVLTIASANPSQADVESAMSVLFPLRLPQARQVSLDPLDELTEALGEGADSERQNLIDAARRGPDAVREALREYIGAAASLSSEEQE